MKVRNFVAKHAHTVNRAQTFKNKKTDYQRRAKHLNRSEV